MANWKKIGNISIWIFMIASLIIILAFTKMARDQRLCAAINIQIDSTANHHFVTRDIVKGMLYNIEGELIGKKFDEINVNRLEKKITENPYIQSANIFLDLNGVLYINIKQRRPIVRFINCYHYESFYYDDRGKMLPLNDEFAARVPVVICDSVFRYKRNIEKEIHISATDTLEKKSIITQTFALARFLDQNPFWNAQIDQIIITKEEEIQLIPRLGNHIIVLGNMENYVEKFENLMLFYKKAINSAGWNTYKEINLKYRNQIVCQKKQ